MQPWMRSTRFCATTSRRHALDDGLMGHQGSVDPCDLNAIAPELSESLLAWWEVHGRKDPALKPWMFKADGLWPDPDDLLDPYGIWIAEVMLQQTQLQVVLPYWQRWMAAFPSLKALAAADEQAVLLQWQGLGYYSRARRLHEAAQLLVGQPWPRTLEGWMALPGIGRTTAGSILSSAFSATLPILDGNVKRVIARHDAVAGWPGSAKTLTELWRLSEQYTPHERVDDYTQGVMDLGATVCTRQNPHCTACPVRATCRAFQRGEQTHYPGRKRRKTLPERQTCFLILQRPDGAVLLEKRPSPGIWGGLWCFPETAAPERTPATLEPLLPHGQQPLRALDSIQHSFSHYRLTILPFIMAIGQPTEVVAEVDSVRWVRPGSDVALGLPAPVSQILDRLLHQQ